MATLALDPFRTLLDHFDETDRGHLIAFFRMVQAAGPSVVEELAGRALRPTAPRALRLLVAEAAYYHTWPEWVPILDRILRHELDFEVFRTGTEALGRIPSEAALQALQEISVIRATPQFQEQVADVLARTDPAEAFRFHLGRLLEGSQNPTAANEAAHRLTELVTPESLPPLQLALRHPDLLIFRHALRLITGIQTQDSAAFLADFLAEAHAEALEDRTLKGVLAEFRLLTVPAMREAVLARLDDLPADGPDGAFRTFLVELQPLVLEGKAAKVAAKLREAGDELHLRARRLGYGIDAAAEGLAAMVQGGCIAPDEIVPLLEEIVEEQTGREGVARALALLVTPEDQARLDLLLDHSDRIIRLAALETLGERLEEALRPALLKACHDAIFDHAQRALFHLGHLPDPETQARNLLADPRPEERDLALRFIAAHELRTLAPDLLAELERSEREDRRLPILSVLGALRAVEAAPVLLELLHSGQSPTLQVALAEALRDMANPDIAEALGEEADAMKQPILHAIAAEAFVRAHAFPEPPMDEAAFQHLHPHVMEAWNDRLPWPLRLRVVEALEGLRLEPPTLYAWLATLLQEALAEKRSPQALAPEALGRLQQDAKTWARISES